MSRRTFNCNNIQQKCHVKDIKFQKPNKTYRAGLIAIIYNKNVMSKTQNFKNPIKPTGLV
jgi:hypothetical protein